MEQGNPQEAMMEAMQGIQSQIDAIGPFAQSVQQAGQTQAAELLMNGAKMLQEGLAALGATPTGGTEPANAGTDVNVAGRNAQPA